LSKKLLLPIPKPLRLSKGEMGMKLKIPHRKLVQLNRPLLILKTRMEVEKENAKRT
jgi:hypothetical protein